MALKLWDTTVVHFLAEGEKCKEEEGEGERERERESRCSMGRRSNLNGIT